MRRGVLALLVLGGCVSLGVFLALLRSPGDEAFVRTGEPAPGFELESLNGASMSLESLRGKVVYVNFWATWCAPCRDEAPALQRLYQELSPAGFEILALSIDKPGDEAKIREFEQAYGLTFPILRDPTEVVYSQYGATGVPETYLIDAEGRLAEAYIGPRDWDEPRYARTIRRLLDEVDSGADGKGTGAGE